MLNSMVVVSIIALFAYYDVLLSIARLMAPSRAFETTERFAQKSIRRIFSLMRSYCRVQLEYENLSGRALPERFLLIANHQSLLDIPVSIALFPGRMLRFVAKRELGDGIPFVSLILRSQGHALIERKGEASQSMRSIRRFARRCAREGTCPVIFPEGTRSRDGEVGAFHTAGVRKILEEGALPIVVAVVEGGWRIARMRDIVRNLGGSRYRIRVLSVSPAMGAKREVLQAVAAARADITAALAEMRAEGAR